MIKLMIVFLGNFVKVIFGFMWSSCCKLWFIKLYALKIQSYLGVDREVLLSIHGQIGLFISVFHFINTFH